MIENALKTLLTKENYKKVMERAKNNREDLEFYLTIYHKLGRDKEKFNKAIEILMDNKDKVIREVDRAIGLHKKAIEKLERIKRGYILNGHILIEEYEDD